MGLQPHLCRPHLVRGDGGKQRRNPATCHACNPATCHACKQSAGGSEKLTSPLHQHVVMRAGCFIGGVQLTLLQRALAWCCWAGRPITLLPQGRFGCAFHPERLPVPEQLPALAVLRHPGHWCGRHLQGAFMLGPGICCCSISGYSWSSACPKAGNASSMHASGAIIWDAWHALGSACNALHRHKLCGISRCISTPDVPLCHVAVIRHLTTRAAACCWGRCSPWARPWARCSSSTCCTGATTAILASRASSKPVCCMPCCKDCCELHPRRAQTLRGPLPCCSSAMLVAGADSAVCSCFLKRHGNPRPRHEGRGCEGSVRAAACLAPRISAPVDPALQVALRAAGHQRRVPLDGLVLRNLLHRRRQRGPLPGAAAQEGAPWDHQAPVRLRGHCAWRSAGAPCGRCGMPLHPGCSSGKAWRLSPATAPF